MEFKTEKNLAVDQLVKLYDSVGWLAYTKEPQRLVQAVAQSLAVISAWQEGQLIGLVRAVGDGETILYIQDLLVQPQWQNRGVGSQLMARLLAEYPEVRQKVLLTEDAPDVRHFYEKWGFASMDQGAGVAFFREY